MQNQTNKNKKIMLMLGPRTLSGVVVYSTAGAPVLCYNANDIPFPQIAWKHKLFIFNDLRNHFHISILDRGSKTQYRPLRRQGGNEMYPLLLGDES